MNEGEPIEGAPEAPAKPVPKPGRGRPRGQKKTGGAIKGKIRGQTHSDTDAHAVLGSMMPDVVAFHYSVMKGQTKATFSGPTGRLVERLPNLPERQKSA
jgi:hypothetical protein